MFYSVIKFLSFLLLLANLIFFAWAQFNAPIAPQQSLLQAQQQIAPQIKQQINPDLLQIKS